MNPQAAGSDIPRTGMLATVRNRTGVIAAVEPFDGDDGRIHLVHLEYQDEHAPGRERLLWELEPERNLLEPTALPDPAQGRRHESGRLRRAPSRRPLDGALALRGPARRRHFQRRAGGESVPRRRPRRGLPARPPVEGAPHAPRQPAAGRRCRPGQDRRSRADPHRAAPAPPHPAGPGPDPGVVAPAVAGRTLG